MTVYDLLRLFQFNLISHLRIHAHTLPVLNIYKSYFEIFKTSKASLSELCFNKFELQKPTELPFLELRTVAKFNLKNICILST